MLSPSLGADGGHEPAEVRRAMLIRSRQKRDLERRKGGGHGGGHASSSGGGGGKSGGGGGGGGKSSGGGGGGGKSSSGGTGTKGRSSTGGTTSHGGTTTIPGVSSHRSPSAFSPGGGKITSIGKGNIFGGRQIGGGTRNEVYGNTRYGSGYPYGGYGSYLGGRAFPFGFWPIYWGPHYYGGDEYGPERNNSRPGGNMTTVQVASTFWKNISTIATLYSAANTTYPLIHAFNIIGDSVSVQAIMDVLVSSSCDVANATIYPYSTSNSSQPRPESVVQYYRSSSFALTLDGYNNTAELASNMPSSNTSSSPNVPDTPISTNSTDMNFLSCVNTTIGEALPIMGAASPSQIVHAHAVGSIGLLWLLFFLFRDIC